MPTAVAGSTEPQTRTKGLFGYEGPPELPDLCREVYKWVQRLDLSFPLRNPRRDCANGFFVAELLSRFFPKEFNMRTYENGLSSHFRNDNWTQIQSACKRHGFQLPSEIVSAVMLEKHGAAVELLELLYEHLSGKKILRAEDAPADANADRKADGVDDIDEDDLNANLSGAIIQPLGPAPEQPTFGSVVTKDIEDGSAIRKKFAR